MSAEPKACEHSTGGDEYKACGAAAEYRIMYGGLPSRWLLVCGEHARRVDDAGTLSRAVRL